MARVTVEDCILNIPNRFDLVIVAGQRAKQIAAGNPLTVDRDNDKDAVVALREVADKTVELDALYEAAIQNFCRKHAPEKLEQPREDAKSREAAESLAEESGDTFEQMRQEMLIGEAGGGAKPAPGMSFEDENVESED